MSSLAQSRHLVVVSLAGATIGMALELEDPVSGGTHTVAFGATQEVLLPAMPQKPGKLVVLAFRAAALASREAGCNFNLELRLNDTPITRRTHSGAERLLGRPAMFQFAEPDTRVFQVFSGSRFMLMYAPDPDTADAMSKDGQGATFVLDVTDLARGVDGNTLSVVNTRPVKPSQGSGAIVVDDIRIGWLSKDLLPAPESRVPERGPMALGVTRDGLGLRQGTAGGFSVLTPNGLELLVETAIGMQADTEPQLRADDEAEPAADADIDIQSLGAHGYLMKASWPELALERHVEIRDGLVLWSERWTNRSERILGVPFRHRLFMRGDVARAILGGDPDVDALAGSAKNPTAFVESRDQPGTGVGVAAESDWLRLLLSLHSRGGVTELYSTSLALAPGSSIDFSLTILPVSAAGGYWTFINALRRRWHCNGVCIERPTFWNYARATADTADETVRRALAHLGPVTLVLGPWQRLGWDAQTVRAGQYPKLEAGSPETPGACPDLDVDAFLTLQHREPGWAALAQEVEHIRRVCPNVRIIQMTHPAMEVAYKPLAHRWPFYSQAIRTADGRIFEVGHYNQAHLYGYAAKDWSVFYYVPRPGSDYLAQLLSDVRRSMDEAGSDGIYCDEFSWAGRSRHYSRYDYGRWDGYSADLDPEGNVLRLKSDNAHATETCQLEMANEVLRRGKFFLGNGAAALRSVNRLPIARFIEGGNGYGTMAGGHLSTVPLVLGNMGNRKTRKGIFNSVKTCLSLGCIYSPPAVNLLLDGPDNFVCKLHPITIREIGPNCVSAEERLITTVSGQYDWPKQDAQLRLFRYDADGALLDRDTVVSMEPTEKLSVSVPEKGLVIAEIVNRRE